MSFAMMSCIITDKRMHACNKKNRMLPGPAFGNLTMDIVEVSSVLCHTANRDIAKIPQF